MIESYKKTEREMQEQEARKSAQRRSYKQCLDDQMKENARSRSQMASRSDEPAKLSMGNEPVDPKTLEELKLQKLAELKQKGIPAKYLTDLLNYDVTKKA